MRLSKLYSNNPAVFKPVEFVTGLNVVMAEIRIPENRKKDTHNLGKTTFGRLLDFCFLSGKDPSFFLFKRFDLFESFVFFLEVELNDTSFITIRRPVANATKISFKMHEIGRQDFSNLSLSKWNHQEIPLKRAKEMLDGLLDWRALKPWSYRKVLGYLLRSQEDFREVFQLRKFASKHADWKPFLAHLLGFDSKLVSDHYQLEQDLSKKLEIVKALEKELGSSVEDRSKIEGLLLLKQKDAEKKQTRLDAFDFRITDIERTKEIVDNVDVRIADLNAQRYSFSLNRKRVLASLKEEQILFNPDEAERLFKEVGIHFSGQIKKDFEQLIAFNHAITEERRRYLQEELNEIESKLKIINSELNNLGNKRSGYLSFLSGTDPFVKYKQVSDEMIKLRADIVVLEKQRTHLHKLQELRAEIRTLEDKRKHIQAQIEEDVERQDSDKEGLFSMIRLFFSEIVEDVIDRKALLSVVQNQVGHLEFKAEILDEAGNATSADLGHTYRKLLCVAFDLAVLRAYLDVKFPRFVYHDGVFESLDDRKKENLLTVIRRHAELGLQIIITLIDSDLPLRTDARSEVFAAEELIVKLHDEGVSGRLFTMEAW